MEQEIERKVDQSQSAESWFDCYAGVYIQGCKKFEPSCDLLKSGCSPSLCQELYSRGFEVPTNAQKYGWPCIKSGKDVTLISPAHTGKTLAYLLPLLTGIVEGNSAKMFCPKVIVLVSTSWQARSVHLQALKIVEWISAELRFRVCCVHCGNEKESAEKIMSGVDVVVGTPPSLLRLFEKKCLDLKGLNHVAYDDGNLLLEKFKFEIDKLSKAFPVTVQKIVAARKCSAYYLAPSSVKLVICAIEAAILFTMDLKVVQCDDGNKLHLLQQTFKNRKKVVIFTSTIVEALELGKQLQLHNWSVCHVTSEFESDTKFGTKILVISDESVKTMNCGVPITHMIHYSLPTSKGTFRQRLSLFYPAYYSGLSCSSVILVTPHCKQQSVMITQFFNRIGKHPPLFLLKLLDEEYKFREKCMQQFDLCYHLKAWGSCRLEKCTSLHKIADGQTQKLQTLIMPKDGTIKLKVHHVANGTRLWASLLKHSPLECGGNQVVHTGPSTYTKLSLDLAEHFFLSKEILLHGNPVEGDVCAFRDSTGAYYRVQVLKFSQPLGFYFHHKEQARVRCIDTGVVRIVDVNQLLTLPARFLDFPAQVFEVFLCGVKPKDEDTDWPQEVVNYMVHYLEGRTIYGRVALSCGQTLWLDPAESKVLLKSISVTTAVFRPLQELKKVDLAEPNLKHLPSLTNALCLPLKRDTCNCGSKFSFAVLPLGEEAKVCVTAVNSLDIFYVQLEACYSSITKMETKLNQAVIPPLVISDISVGDVCAAKFPVDDKWYRGLVLSVDATSAEVFFVDYGDTEWVLNSSVKPIHQSLLQLPFQAIECSLNSSIELKKYSDDAIWTVTRDKMFYVKVSEVSPTVERARAGMMRYVVELQECNKNLSLLDLLSDYMHQLHISINIYYEQQLKYTRKYVYVIPVWKDLSDTVESYYATASSNKLLAICTHFVFKGCHFRIVIWI